MSLRRVRRIAWLTAIVLAVLGGVSYVYPVNTVIPTGVDTLYHLSLNHGNIRVVHFEAEVFRSHADETALGEHVQFWSDIPTKRVAWRYRDLTLPDGTGIEELVIGFTLFAPIVFIGVLSLIRLTRPWRLKLSLQELVRPSDRFRASSVRRLLRGMTVGLCVGLAVISAWLWVISYIGFPGWCDGINRFGLDLRTWDHTVSYHSTKSSLRLTASDGCVVVRHNSRVAKTFTVPTYLAVLNKLGWIEVKAQPHRFRLCGTAMASGRFQYLRTTNELVLGLRAPCWVLVLLSSAWPILAFIRGPFRRASRRDTGYCVHCGYNLTGLVRPRCPECGTPTVSGRIPDPDPDGTVDS